MKLEPRSTARIIRLIGICSARLKSAHLRHLCGSHVSSQVQVCWRNRNRCRSLMRFQAPRMARTGRTMYVPTQRTAATPKAITDAKLALPNAVKTQAVACTMATIGVRTEDLHDLPMLCDRSYALGETQHHEERPKRNCEPTPNITSESR